MKLLAQLMIGLMLALGSVPALAGDAAGAAAGAAADANLFVFRSVAYPVLSSSTLKIDGAKVATLKNRSYTATRISGGIHQVRLDKALLTGGVNAQFDLEVADNKVYFIEYSGDFGTNGAAILISANTRQIDEETARAYMKAFRFIAPDAARAAPGSGN